MERWKIFLLVGVLLAFLTSLETTLSESPYKLPYPAGKEHTVMQGNFGGLSHNDPKDPRPNYAFDFNLADGELVVASRTGKVLSIQDKFGRGGKNSDPNKVNYVLIDHKDGTSALYLHLQKDSIVVQEGEEVAQGQVIGRADSSGYVTGAHLHFQVQITPKEVWYDLSKGFKRGWYTQSIQISFSDADVLAKEPDGIPQEGESYISDNTPPPAVSESKIAYIRPDDGKIYLVNADGTDERKLSIGPVHSIFEWLPDESKILYNKGSHDLEGVFLINVVTGEETKILAGKAFTKLSPDGNQFLYWNYENTSWAVFDLQTGSSEFLPIHKLTPTGPISWTWSPDSKKVAYIDDFVDEQGFRGRAIWIISLDTLEQEILWGTTAGAVGKPIFLSWSPDGSKIGFASTLVRQGLGYFTFQVIDIDSKSLTEIVALLFEPRCGLDSPMTLLRLIDVHWIQGEAKIVLSYPDRCRELVSTIFDVEPELSGPGIWLFEEGEEPKRISELSGYNGIDISPDGTFLVFTSDSQLYIINTDGSKLKKIAESVFSQPIIAP